MGYCLDQNMAVEDYIAAYLSEQGLHDAGKRFKGFGFRSPVLLRVMSFGYAQWNAMYAFEYAPTARS